MLQTGARTPHGGQPDAPRRSGQDISRRLAHTVKGEEEEMGNAKKRFRVGFVGAGTHATNMLYPALTYLDDFEIERVAICDLIKEKAQRIASMYGVGKVYTDHRKMFENEKLDGVVVCINAA